MIKKIIIGFISIFILLIVTSVYIEENLIKHTVYYAQHLPHGKNRHPVPAIIIDDIEIIKHPDINDYKYISEFEGAQGISNDKYSLRLYSEGLEFVEYSKTTTSYSFGDKENLKTVFEDNESNTNLHQIDINSINEKKLWQKIDNFLKPFIKSQPKPKVNLQWIFDWKYKERFQ